MLVMKTIRTETAHRLYEYNGACANIHGHSYRFDVVLRGSKLNKLGILLDFSTIKEEIGSIIMETFDHALVLKSCDPLVKTLGDSGLRIRVMNENPTAENMAQVLFSMIEVTEHGYLLEAVRVWETGTAYATYSRQDFIGRGAQ